MDAIKEWSDHLDKLQQALSSGSSAASKLNSSLTDRAIGGSTLSGAAAVALRRKRIKDESSKEDDEPVQAGQRFKGWCNMVANLPDNSNNYGLLAEEQQIHSLVKQQEREAIARGDRPDLEPSKEEVVHSFTYSGQCLKTFRNQDSPVSCLTVLRNGNLVSGCEDGVVRIWNAKEGEELYSIKDLPDAVYCCDVLIQDESEFLVCGVGNKIYLWDSSTWKQFVVLEGHASYVWSVCKLGKSGEQILASCSADQTVRMWCTDSKQYEFGACLASLDAHRDSIYCMDVFPDKSSFATGSADTDIIIWRKSQGANLMRYSPRRVLKGHKKLVHSLVVLSPDYLASSSLDWSIRIWDVDNGFCLNVLEGHEEAVTTLAAFFREHSLQAPILFSGSRDCDIKVWDMADGYCQKTLTGHRDEIRSLKILGCNSSSGVLASGCECGDIKIWGVVQL
eukprot:m.136373 g.136373  ORF g.136373 m.136373 type:complete len:449 (-) comp14731_c0_seq2:27-1373(-)